MNEDRTFTACVVIIGDEVLSGRTQDANLRYLGERLNGIGIRLAEARVIADDANAIVRTLNEVRAAFDYVFTTGGIGPTHDDITAAAVAKTFGVKLHRDPEALRLLTDHYRPQDINEARLRMADVPEGATLISNPVSKAPGFRIGNVYVMAGVPRIMQAQFDGIAPSLKGGRPVRSHTISAHVSEGKIAIALGEIQARHPEVAIGSYPFVRDGRIGTSLVFRCVDAECIPPAAAELRTVLAELGVAPAEEFDA